MSKHDPLLAKCKEKAERVSKPFPVDVPGIGRMYVRPRLMGERDEADAAMSEGDFDAVCSNVARMLCEEDGTRKSPEVTAQFAAVFMQLPQTDVVQIGNAADGNTPEKAEQAGN